MKNAEYIVAGLPKSSELKERYGIEFQGRIQPNGTAQLFFVAPFSAAFGLLKGGLDERGIDVRGAVQNGQAIQGVYTLSDNEGWRFRGFVEALSLAYPDVYFELPALNDDEDVSLWIDGRLNGRSLDLVRNGNSAALVLGLHNPQEAFSDTAREVLTAQYGFIAVKDSPGFVTNQGVKVNDDGRVSVQLGRYLKMMGEDTTLTPMRSKEIAGQALIESPVASASSLPRKINDHVELIGRALSVTHAQTLPPLSQLKRSLRGENRGSITENAEVVHPTFGSNGLIENVDRLRSLHNLKPEYRDAVTALLGLSIGEDDWQRNGAQYANSIADLVGLHSTGNFSTATTAASLLSDKVLNPGFDEDQWSGFLFDANGTPQSDTYGAVGISELLVARWDASLNTTSTAITKSNSMNDMRDATERARIDNFFNDPFSFSDDVVFETNSALLLTLTRSREEEQALRRSAESEDALIAMATEHLKNKSANSPKDVFSLTDAHIVAGAMAKEQLQAGSGPTPFDLNSFDFDDVVPDDYDSAYMQGQALSHADSLESDPVQDAPVVENRAETPSTNPGLADTATATSKDELIPEVIDDGAFDLDSIDAVRQDNLADLVAPEKTAEPANNVEIETVIEEKPIPALAQAIKNQMARQKSAAVLEDVKKNNNPNRVVTSEFSMFDDDISNNTPESDRSKDSNVSLQVEPTQEATPTIDSEGNENTEAVTQDANAVESSVSDDSSNANSVSTESDIDSKPETVKVEKDEVVVEARPPENVEDAVLLGRIVPSIEQVRAIQLYRQVLEKGRGMSVLNRADPLVTRGDHYFASILPKESQTDLDTIEKMEANFELILSDLIDQPFSSLAQNRYESVFPKKLRALTGLMGYLEPKTNYDHLSTLEGDVAAYVSRTEFLPSEIDVLVEGLPLQAATVHAALADKLVAAKDFASLVELGSRHVNKSSTLIPKMIDVMGAIPEDDAVYPASEKLIEMLSSIQAPQSERKFISDKFLSSILDKADQQGLELTKFYLDTGYKKKDDTLPLSIESSNPNNGDFVVSVMNPFLAVGRDGVFTPEIVFNFDSGELTHAIVADGDETSRIDAPQLTVLWERISAIYQSGSEVSLKAGSIPQISAVADMDVDRVDDFDPDSVLSTEQDDELTLVQGFDDVEPEPESEEENIEVISPVRSLAKKEDIDLNLKGQMVSFVVQSLDDGKSGFRVVDGKPYKNPIDALLMPSDMEFSSEEHQAFIVFQLASILARPDVVSGKRDRLTHSEIISLAAAMSVSEKDDFPSADAARYLFEGEDGNINVAMVEECLEAAEAKVARQIVIGEIPVNGIAIEEALKNISSALPKRVIRTGEQRAMQQFSTPILAAYHLGELIQNHAEVQGISNGAYFEPTAGTGSLMINLPEKSRIRLNELSEKRRALLAYSMQTNAKDTAVDIWGHDAVVRDFRSISEGYDGVIANPPFGSIEQAVEIDGYKTKRLDHAIVLRSLQALKENGAGTFIIGADSFIESKRGELSNASQAFFNHVMDNYNVLGLVHVELDQYEQRDASFPLTVFTVQGRFPTLDRVRVSDPLPTIMSMDQLANWVEDTKGKQLTQEAMLDVKIESVAALESLRKEKQILEQTSAQLTRGSRERDLERRKAANKSNAVSPKEPDSQFGDLEAPSPLKKSEDEPVEESTADRSEGAGASQSNVTPIKAVDQTKADDVSMVGRYKPRSKIGRTDVGSVVISDTMRAGIEKALDYTERRYGSIENLLVFGLGMPSSRIDKTFADYQCDAIALTLTQMDLSSEFVNAMGTGTGKGIVQAAMLQMVKTLNERLRADETPLLAEAGVHQVPVLFMCEKPDMFQDFFERDVGMVDERLRDLFFPIIVNNDSKSKIYLMADGKRGDLIAEHDTKLFAKLKESKSFAGLVPEGKIPLVMTTYSQHQNTGYLANGKTVVGQVEKNDLIRTLSNNALVMFDESHNAAGEDSNIGAFVDSLKSNALFVMNSSATAAKRLTQAPAYQGIFGPSVDFEKLGEISMDDSEYLLEILFRGASELGSFFSVNRDLSRTEFEYSQNPKYEARDLEIGDKFAMALQALGKFSGEVTNSLELRTEQYRAENDALTKHRESLPTGAPTSVTSTNFGSLNHQLCKFFTLLINLDSTVDQALADHSDGKRVVIALDSTGEAIVKDYLEEIYLASQVKEMHENGASEEELAKVDMSYGQALTLLDGVKLEGNSLILPYEMDARDALKRTLDRMQWVTERRSGEKSVKRNVFAIAQEAAEKKLRDSQEFNDMDAEEAANALQRAKDEVADQLNKAIDRIRDAIDEIGPVLPLSPIDYLAGKLSDAGLNVGEMSGRQTSVLVGNGQTIVSKVRRPDKNSLKSRFNHLPPENDKRLDCLILTRTGASGISLHDSVTNRYNARRSMIYAQLPDDVNTFLQFGGRVDRAGGVSDPKAVLIGSGLLFPKKAVASMVRKLQQSGAATMGNRDGSRKLPEAPDYFNVIGDRAAYELLVDNPDILQLFAEGGMTAARDLKSKLEGDRSRAKNKDDRFDSMTDLAKKLVSYTSIMTQDQGTRVSNELEARYSSLYDNLARIGLNPLVTKRIDGSTKILSSATVHSAVSVLPDGRDDPFSGDVQQAVVEINEPVRADPIEDVNIEIMAGGAFCRNSELLETLKVQRGETLHKVADALSTRKSALLSRFVSKEDIDAAISKSGKAETEAEDKMNAVSHGLSRENSRVSEVNQRLDFLSTTLRNMGVGYTIKLPSEYSEEEVTGVIRDIFVPESISAVASLSSWRVKVAVPNEGHTIYSLSHLHDVGARFIPEYWKDNGLYEALRDQTSIERSRRRDVLMGNQVTGMMQFTALARNASTARGSVEGIDQSLMLLPYNIQAEQLPARSRPALSSVSAAKELIDFIVNRGPSEELTLYSNATTKKTESGIVPATHLKIQGDVVALHVPKSVYDRDSAIYKDDEIRRLAMQDFSGRSDYMSTKFHIDQVNKLLPLLVNKFKVSLYAPIEHRGHVERFNEDKKHDLEGLYRESRFESLLGVPDDLSTQNLSNDSVMMMAADSFLDARATPDDLAKSAEHDVNFEDRPPMPTVNDVLGGDLNDYDLFSGQEDEITNDSLVKRTR